jgi:leucyl/phenylalanyl-tRNA--protein transferase
MIPWLAAGAPFPSVESARKSPNGLLAASEELDADRLVEAYRHGIFPWYSRGEPVLWWSPDPRMILVPDELHVSHSLRKRLRATARSNAEEVVVDRDFEAVILACGNSRAAEGGTWITPEVRRAYVDLHRRGLAHSVEVRLGDELLAGLYGVALGRMFYGESMFTRATDRSKTALVTLVQIMLEEGVPMIDCQQATSHLRSLGGRPIARARFCDQVAISSEQRSIDWSSWAGRSLNHLLEGF